MISFIADVHVGNHKKCGGELVGHINTRCREVITSFGTASGVAADGSLIILGDLFDRHNPHPAILKATGDALYPKTPTFVLAGNHDIASSHEGDSAISVLDWLPHVHCVTSPTLLTHESFNGTSVLAVPFIPGNMADNVRGVLEDADFPEGTILAAHFGISDTNTPEWLVNTESSVSIHTVRSWCDKYKLGGVFVGDWHDRKQWAGPNKQPIVQVGALVPTGWDNLGHNYGHVTTYNAGDIKSVQVPGPRYFNIDTPTEAEDVLRKLNAKNFARFKIKSELLPADYIQELEKDARILDIIHDVSVSTSRESAKNAVEAVKSGTNSIEELASTYIAGMDIPDATKEAVLDTTLAYLKRGDA